jgi:hypothetical protein
MGEIGKILLGAAIAFIATLVIERWKQVHASRAAAIMVLRELEFHRQRLQMATSLDQSPYEYDLKFPMPVWNSQGTALVAGAPVKQADAILQWYALMTVLGNSISKTTTPQGTQLGGPDRTRLKAVLDEAYFAAQKLSERGSFGKRRSPNLSLFEDIRLPAFDAASPPPGESANLGHASQNS